MATPTVRQVMMHQVVAVREDVLYKEIVQVLDRFNVSAVPVLDRQRRVLGVVSEADLMAKVEFADDASQAPLFERRSRRKARGKAAGETARDLMSAPAVTIGPEASTMAAARLMDDERVKRLPVVNESGVLVGIVSRRDLLAAYLRRDDDIRQDVRREVLGQVLGLHEPQVRVSVSHGVVALHGTVDRRSTARIAARLVHGVPGVVDVVDDLAFEYDDSGDVRRRYPFDAGV
jgi:CBS domain-containing protein